MSFLHSTNTTTTETTTKVNWNGKNFSLLWGINDYPGTDNDLQGCVNDALDWENLLVGLYGFQNKLLLNSKATKSAVKNILNEYAANSKEGDRYVFGGSSHGTSIPDSNNDEPDGKDEAIVLYDDLLLDDDVREIINKFKPGCSITVISDSCFSGTVTRAFLTAMDDVEYIKARYLPPDDPVVAAMISALPVKTRVFYPETNMREILLSGCTDNEYSYDTKLGGKARGTMSYYATKVIRENPNATWEQFYAGLRNYLPTKKYPQTPCLEGSVDNKKKILFS